MSNWVLMSYRRNIRAGITLEELGNEIADELNIDFELKDNGNLSFKDKQ